jgi:hypothetical protein
MMDTTGIPSIVGDEPSTGAFADEAGKNELLQLTGPAQVGLSALVMTMLAMQEAEQVIGIDTAARKVWCIPSDNVGTIASGMETGNKICTLIPTTGQDGKSLAWEVSGTPTSGFPEATKAAIDAILAPVTPKFTVGSLVARIAAELPENAEAQIVIRQDFGQVKVISKADATAIATPTLTDCPVNGGIVLALTEPASDGSTDTLKFEGGAV